MDNSIKTDVLNLLELKAKTSELGYGSAITCINTYIENKFSELDDYIKNLTVPAKGDWKKLNDIFLSSIY